MNSQLRNRRGLQLGIFLLALAVAAHAEPSHSSSDSSSKPDGSTVVTLPFSVVDSRNQPITDIKPGDLTLLDDKQLVQSIDSVKRGEELPLRLGVLIDTSGSHEKSRLYQPAVGATAKLLNKLLTGPSDGVFVINFSDDPEQHATPFMNVEQLSKYKVHLNPHGGTALYDAIVYACNSRMRKDEPQQARRVLIILSDGEDNASGIKYDQAIPAALEALVAIYAVSTGDDSQKMSGSERGNTRLKQLARETGGQALVHLRIDDIDQAFSMLRSDIENMYAVSFEPTDHSRKGFHSFELRITRGEGLQISHL